MALGQDLRGGAPDLVSVAPAVRVEVRVAPDPALVVADPASAREEPAGPDLVGSVLEETSLAP